MSFEFRPSLLGYLGGVIAGKGNRQKQLRKDVELLLSFIDSSVNKLPKDNDEYNTFIDNTEVPGPDNNTPNHKLDQLLLDLKK